MRRSPAGPAQPEGPIVFLISSLSLRPASDRRHRSRQWKFKITSTAPEMWAHSLCNGSSDKCSG